MRSRHITNYSYKMEKVYMIYGDKVWGINIIQLLVQLLRFILYNILGNEFTLKKWISFLKK